MFLEKRISEVSELPSGCPADLVFHPSLQQAINYVQHTDFPMSVPCLTFCTVSPSSAITDKLLSSAHIILLARFSLQFRLFATQSL